MRTAAPAWLALGLVLGSRTAAAQVGEPGYTPSNEPDPAPALTAPPPADPDPPVNEPLPREARPSHSVTSLAVVAGYRAFFDLQGYGGGVALSYGGDRPVSGQFNLRLFGGRTLGGLGLFEATPTGTLEIQLGQGFRFGIGGGLAVFTVIRATTGDTILSCGPTGVMRLAYDFAPHHAAFIQADFDAEWQAGTGVLGPTLAVGYRF